MTLDEQQEDEYTNRVYYLRTVFEAYSVKWDIGNLTEYWKGTQAAYDVEIKKYEERNLKVFKTEKTEDEPFMYNYECIEPDYEELKRRRIFARTQNKNSVIKHEQNRYLKSGY